MPDKNETEQAIQNAPEQPPTPPTNPNVQVNVDAPQEAPLDPDERPKPVDSDATAKDEEDRTSPPPKSE